MQLVQLQRPISQRKKELASVGSKALTHRQALQPAQIDRVAPVCGLYKEIRRIAQSTETLHAGSRVGCAEGVAGGDLRTEIGRQVQRSIPAVTMTLGKLVLIIEKQQGP